MNRLQGNRTGKNDVVKMSGFRWDKKKTAAAIGLAEGKTQQEVADGIKVNIRTIQRWVYDTEFSAEVDRLAGMVGLASRAERMRVAMRVARAKGAASASPKTGKDLLDWLKFAKSETDQLKLDLAAHAAAFGGDDRPVAD